MNIRIAEITHHEAGHAVAALMTADIADDQMTVSVTVINGVGTGYGPLVSDGDHPMQAAFILYAGPWAEARVRWGKPVHGLEDTSDEGTSFRQAVEAAFADGATLSGRSDRARYAVLAKANPSVPAKEQEWSEELERAWPAIEQLAQALRNRLDNARPDTDSMAPVGHVRRTASMPNREVVALVRPLLEERKMWHYLA
ncbi:hypothetical protein [Mycolicibacterium goodii]|uniref:hypothetical protein n=1 Tax=Mycolicibacterium goodii TaxID=134601 RepID=UPI0010559976|nr:hypothetical protein [Mycolicibacterium goodii]